MSIYEDYQEGGRSAATGGVIGRLIRKNSDAIVYFNEGGSLVYEFDDKKVGNDLSFVREKFSELDSKVPTDASEDFISSLRYEIGCALFAALCSTEKDSANACFDAISEKLERVKSLDAAKLLYVGNAVAIAAVLLIVTISLYVGYSSNHAIFSQIVLCVGCGITGSLFSSLQRKWTRDINLLSPNWIYSAQAGVQLLSGAISGLVVFLASQADIALGFAKDDIYSLLFFCIVSGFSERYSPNLLAKGQQEGV